MSGNSENRTSSFGGDRKRSRSDCAVFLGSAPFSGPVCGGSTDGEELDHFGHGVFPGGGCWPGDFHSFARAHADEVRFEFSEHRQDVKQQFADGVGGVVDGTIDVEFDFASGEVVGYFVGLWDGTG